MKIFYNTKFEGHYPIGSSAIVCANNASEAADMLNKDLIQQGLVGDQTSDSMIEVKTTKPLVIILNNGNY